MAAPRTPYGRFGASDSAENAGKTALNTGTPVLGSAPSSPLGKRWPSGRHFAGFNVSSLSIRTVCGWIPNRSARREVVTNVIGVTKVAPAAGLHCLPAAVPWVETSAVGRRWVCACGGPLLPSADSACWWSYAGVLFPAGGSGCLAGVASLVVVPGVVGGGAARQEACAWVVWFAAVQGRRCAPGNGQPAQRFDAPESEHNAHRLATAPCTCTLHGTPSPLRRSRSSTKRQQRARAASQLPQGEALPGERNATAPTHITPPERSPPAAGATAQDTRHRRRAHGPRGAAACHRDGSTRSQRTGNETFQRTRSVRREHEPPPPRTADRRRT